VDGSIKNLFKDHPEGKNIEAKTGALENERALSGYAHSSRYGPLAFAVMVNHSLAGVEITKFMESVLLRLVEA
jgi:D-alanyl-D-alanine carboxypeptidase